MDNFLEQSSFSKKGTMWQVLRGYPKSLYQQPTNEMVQLNEWVRNIFHLSDLFKDKIKNKKNPLDNKHQVWLTVR